MDIKRLGYVVNKDNRIIGKYGYIYKKDSHNFAVCVNNDMVSAVIRNLGIRVEKFTIERFEEVCMHIKARKNYKATPEEVEARNDRISKLPILPRLPKL